MADKCGYCKEHKPTNHLVLNGGDLWIEFCEECGNTQTLVNTSGDSLTIKQIYDKSGEKSTHKN